jgi:protease II
VAPPRPHVVGSPHGSRNDPYYWLRDDTDRNSLLFKVDMAAGHGGRSGRFESLKETAEEYAFILHALGRRE